MKPSILTFTITMNTPSIAMVDLVQEPGIDADQVLKLIESKEKARRRVEGEKWTK